MVRVSARRAASKRAIVDISDSEDDLIPKAKVARSSKKQKVQAPSPVGKKKQPKRPIYDDEETTEDSDSPEESNDDFEDGGDDSEFEDAEAVQSAPVRSTRRSTRSKPQSELLELSEDEDGKTTVKKVKPIKKEHHIYDDDEEEEIKPVPAKKPSTPRARPVLKPKVKPTATHDGPSSEDILARIPDAVLPVVDPSKKVNFFALKAAQASGPQPVGDIEIPIASENCLAGLTFVFTGLMPRLPRDQAQDLVKRYGGKVTTAPSGRTSCVVLGGDAGPSKIQKIKKLHIKAIDEDGFLQLLREMPADGGSGEAAQKAILKKQLEEEKVEVAVQELAEEIHDRYKEDPSEEARELWTSKYAPTDLSQICGNKGPIEKLSRWLADWQKSFRSDFRRSGTDGSGAFRAFIISGPPGIGKTTAAHLAAKLHGYDILETNASDTRSKNLLAESMNGTIKNTSINGFFGHNSDPKIRSSKRHLCLIMDEVDGMSGGDRGGVGQMAALCRTTDIPIILICNERSLPKMRPFDRVAFDLQFRRPDANALRVRILGIAKNEGISLTNSVVDQLVSTSSSDMRQIINILFTFSRTNSKMDFDTNKEFGKMCEKTITLKPFDITARLLAGSTFSANSRITFDEKLRYYFDDHDFTPLMIQENYLNTHPSSVSNGQFSSHLDAVVAAADAISDGDLVDKRIRGSQPQWSLMPFHGVMSTLLPCSYIAGQGLGRYNFTTYLGQNSKANKYTRLLQELQSHARLRISGDIDEVRLQYLPQLTYKLIKPILLSKAAGVDEVMEVMDYYYLTKEDWDVIMELGVGTNALGSKAKGLPTAVKSAFTRQYNKSSHPVPFMKTAAMFTAKATAATLPNEVPDLEETIGEEVAPVDDADAATGADDLDLSKDKYVKMAKPKANKRTTAKSKPSARKRKPID